MALVIGVAKEDVVKLEVKGPCTILLRGNEIKGSNMRLELHAPPADVKIDRPGKFPLNRSLKDYPTSANPDKRA